MNNRDKVRQFHLKFGFPVDQRPATPEKEVHDLLLDAAETATFISVEVLDAAQRHQRLGDERLYRMHLLLEEMGELLHAMAANDRVKIADGLVDLEYVTHGTAVTYGITTDLLFDDVHRANMSKVRSESDPRMSVRPADYQPPRIRELLESMGEL